MERIPDAELERLKSEISVERLIEAAGIALRPAGASYPLKLLQSEGRALDRLDR